MPGLPHDRSLRSAAPARSQRCWTIRPKIGRHTPTNFKLLLVQRPWFSRTDSKVDPPRFMAINSVIVIGIQIAESSCSHSGSSEYCRNNWRRIPTEATVTVPSQPSTRPQAPQGRAWARTQFPMEMPPPSDPGFNCYLVRDKMKAVILKEKNISVALDYGKDQVICDNFCLQVLGNNRSNHIKPLKLLIARVLIAFGLTAASPAFAASSACWDCFSLSYPARSRSWGWRPRIETPNKGWSITVINIDQQRS